MSEKVFLEEGGSISVHTRIKDMCKAARNRQGLSNQDICDLICKRFGLEDFSINTVNNFFSERSKATTIYTTGYICAVLDISIDAVFGIESSLSSAEEAEFCRQLADIKTELRFKDQEMTHLQEKLQDKDQQLAEKLNENELRYEEKLQAKDAQLDAANKAIEYYRAESAQNTKKVQPWVFKSVLALLAAALVFIAIYLIKYDVGNAQYGLFHG